MASLKHGVFNMGFVGIADTVERRRLLHGLIVNGFLSRRYRRSSQTKSGQPHPPDDYRVLRSPAFNVATEHYDPAGGGFLEGMTVNGEALGFTISVALTAAISAHAQ